MSVGARVLAAREALRVADEALPELDALTRYLVPPGAALRRANAVHETFDRWLGAVRGLAAELDAAGLDAGPPAGFVATVERALADPLHRYLVEDDRASHIELQVLHDDGRELAFWAFAVGPHRTHPLVPVCQRYADWCHHRLLCPAAEALWPWPAAAA